MFKFRVFCFCCLLLVQLSCLAQRNFYFDKTTTEKGLSNNTINCITQDLVGNMWFGSYDGLNCFDGERISVFKHDLKNPQSIANNKIENLYCDKKGNLWIKLPGNIISRYVRQAKPYFRNYEIKTLDKNAIDRLTENAAGEFCLVMTHQVLKYNALKDCFVVSNEKLKSDTTQLQLQKIKSLLPDFPIEKYICSAPNQYWASTRSSGLFLISGLKDGAADVAHITQNAAHYSLSNNEVYDIFADRYGILWVGTKDGGVNRLLPQASNLNTVCHEASKPNTLPEGTIRAICQDHRRNIWIGTYNQGVAIYDQASGRYSFINHLDDKKNADWDRIRSIYSTTDQSVWIGSYMGLCRIKPNGERKYYQSGQDANSLISGRIYSMAEDKRGYLWIGTWHGLDRFNLNKDCFEHININGLSDNHIRMVYVDQQGKIWIGTEAGGISIFDQGKGTSTTLKNVPNNINSLTNNSIFSILQDKEGMFWIGTADGLDRYDAVRHTFKHFTTENGLMSNLVLGVMDDKNGRIWASTSKGASCIDPKTFFIKNYDCSDGWINNELTEGAYAKGIDSDLFFGGTNGVNFLKPENMPKNKIAPDVSVSAIYMDGKQLSTADHQQSLQIGYYGRNGEIILKATHTQSPWKNTLAWRILPSDSAWHFSYNSQTKIPLTQFASGVFHIQYKAANSDGLWSQVYTYEIKVNAPFWRASWFYITLLILIAISVIAFIQFLLLDERKRNKRLEELVNERTQKIQEQRLLLQTKNEELTAYNNDILKQKDQILAQRDHLFELHQKLEAESEARTTFFTNISHEIRTPLTLIYGPIESLMSSLKPEKEKEQYAALNMVKEQTDYLLSLVNQSLDFRKLEAGRMQLEPQMGDMVQFCREMTSFFLPEAQNIGIDLRFKSNTESLLASFDFEKIRQILNNLLSNALKFTPQNGCINVQLTVKEETEQIQIMVQDNGIGIPADRIEFIFDRFYQIGRAVNQITSGSGIGLSLARELVELHQGSIEVESEPDRGSAFIVSLPILNRNGIKPENEAQLVSHHEELTLDESPENVEKKSIKSILLVEDNATMMDYISGLLTKQDYKVYKATNGLEAMKVLKNKNINLILSDWLMPEMNGLDFCQKVKAKKSMQHIPFVMLTARTSGNDQLIALQNGVDDFISKPFSEQILIHKLSTLLNREQQLIDSYVTQLSIAAEDKKEITEDEKLFTKIVQTINDHLSESSFNPDELGSIVGISKMKLYRKCKKLTGYAPIELIKSIRLKRAAQLLGQNGYTISEVGFKVGFNDPKYFSRCFQKMYNITPSQYQEDKNAKKNIDGMLISD